MLDQEERGPAPSPFRADLNQGIGEPPASQHLSGPEPSPISSQPLVLPFPKDAAASAGGKSKRGFRPPGPPSSHPYNPQCQCVTTSRFHDNRQGTADSRLPLHCVEIPEKGWGPATLKPPTTSKLQGRSPSSFPPARPLPRSWRSENGDGGWIFTETPSLTEWRVAGSASPAHCATSTLEPQRMTPSPRARSGARSGGGERVGSGRGAGGPRGA